MTARHRRRAVGARRPMQGVDRSTITRAINEIRPLLAERGCRVNDGIRLRTRTDVVADLDHVRDTALMNATEIRVRRPTVTRAGRQQFISGTSRTNAVKALAVTDDQGRLICGATVRTSTADITQARQSGSVDWLTHTTRPSRTAAPAYGPSSTGSRDSSPTHGATWLIGRPDKRTRSTASR